MGHITFFSLPRTNKSFFCPQRVKKKQKANWGKAIFSFLKEKSIFSPPDTQKRNMIYWSKKILFVFPIQKTSIFFPPAHIKDKSLTGEKKHKTNTFCFPDTKVSIFFSSTQTRTKSYWGKKSIFSAQEKQSLVPPPAHKKGN